MIIISEGGYRSGKTIFLVYCAKIAARGGLNRMLRRRYMNRYQIIANMALYFGGIGRSGQPVPYVCDRAPDSTRHFEQMDDRMPRLVVDWERQIAYREHERTGHDIKHLPYVVVDWRYKRSYIRRCNCFALAKSGGNLDPLDLAERAYKRKEFPPYTSVIGHEWHRWMESRITSMLPRKSQLHRLLSNYLFDETGKAHMDFLIDTQNRYKVDNRIRDFAGYLAVCENLTHDPEHDPPTSLHYTIVKDPFAFHPQVQEFYPPPKWGLALMDLYDTWEAPKYKSEAEVAVEEAEEDLKKMEKNISRIEGTVLEPEMEYEGRKARRMVAQSAAKMRSTEKKQANRPIATTDAIRTYA